MVVHDTLKNTTILFGICDFNHDIKWIKYMRKKIVWIKNKQKERVSEPSNLFRLRRLQIPAHVNIEGNDKTDKIAKKSTRVNKIISIPFGKGEAKAIIKKEMMKKWQDRWDMDNSVMKYYSIQKCINAQGVNARNRM